MDSNDNPPPAPEAQVTGDTLPTKTPKRRKAVKKDATVEARVQSALKKAAMAKAKKEGTSISAIFESSLIDYVTGSLVGRARTPAERHGRAVLGAEFRRMLLKQGDLLCDLRNLASTTPDSPLAAAAMQKLFEEVVILNRATFRLLASHVC